MTIPKSTWDRDPYDEFYALKFDTVAAVKRGIEIIAAKKSDDEVAHVMEDHLREGVLKHIASYDSESELSRMALLALTTGDIDFARWCA